MEVNMADTDVGSESTSGTQSALAVDMKLEVVTLPVSDVDRAKRFYEGLGWRLDADIAAGDDFRVVQFTPPHSQCSIHFGKGLTASAPGSVDRMILAVTDIDAARNALISRGVDVGEVYETKPPGFDEPGRSYFAYAKFSDPDGNGWLLQEITTRLPGREWED
jgi:catechol 2,3-dioxygenase-like lactoylglutathione lyase family enzyme